jgi:hypothetical protein
VSNVAVTVVSVLTVAWQVPVPLQPPPDHPVKWEPDAAAAVSVTCVPELKAFEQLPPQLIPDGELVTVPVPEPDFETINVCVPPPLCGALTVTVTCAVPTLPEPCV